MTKHFKLVALIAAVPLVLSGCAGSNLRNSFDEANAHSLIHIPIDAAETPVPPAKTPAQAQLPVAHSPAPKIVGEQALLDPSSVVRDGQSVKFIALDGTVTARIGFDCPSRTGNLRENGVYQTFALSFTPRFTKAALEACGELPMPEPLTADQKKFLNPNPTKADYEREQTDFICGSFMHMPLSQQMGLIESAKTNPRVRKEIEPCLSAIRAGAYP